MTDAQRKETVKPITVAGSRLEGGDRAEVVFRGVDWFVFVQPFHDSRRPMTDAAMAHANHRVIMCLQNKADVQKGDIIGADDRPVGTARQHRAL